jgi:hypothetical protein
MPYKILYGPPNFRSPFLLLGYQPGGRQADAQSGEARGEREGWPEACEYATERWPLARHLRSMFGTESIQNSVGLNAIFLRSPSAAEFAKLPRPLKDEIWDFCLPHVEWTVSVLEPERIVVLGPLRSDPTRSAEPERPPAYRNGKVAKRPGIGIIHPTGARLSSEDRLEIAERVRGTGLA